MESKCINSPGTCLSHSTLFGGVIYVAACNSSHFIFNCCIIFHCVKNTTIYFSISVRFLSSLFVCCCCCLLLQTCCDEHSCTCSLESRVSQGYKPRSGNTGLWDVHSFNLTISKLLYKWL